MSEQNYYAIPQKPGLLIADRDSLLAFFLTRQEHLLERLYRQGGIFTTPGIYKYLVKHLAATELKDLRRFVREVRYHANKSELAEITKDTEILTANEAFSVLCAREKHLDVLLDDPRKIEILRSYSVHGIRPSDLVVAAATAEKK